MHRRSFLNTAAVAAVASLPGCMAMAPAVASIRNAAPYIPGMATSDPAIDQARAYWRAYEAVCRLPDTAGDDARDITTSAWDEASHVAYRTRPITVAGAYALLGVIRSRETGCVHDDETDVALATLHDGLLGIAMS